jgi:hypothetical protein
MMAHSMNLVLQFHDSEVRQIRANGDELSVAFSAASVRRVGSAARSEGYVSNLELRLAGATWAGPLADAVGSLSTGALSIDGVPVSPVPLPWACEGRVAVTLDFANGTRLTLAARSVELRFAGEPRLVESYVC